MDFTHEELKILQEAIDHYGEESQLDMAIEEMSELTKAICKYKRAVKERERDICHSTAKDVIFAKGDIVEEIADVYVMLEQLTVIFNCKERVSAIASEKIRRLKGRMDND
mgnify:CR=1 FL=1